MEPTGSKKKKPSIMVELPKNPINRVIHFEWRHKDLHDNLHEVMIKDLVGQFDGNKNYTVEQVIDVFKRNFFAQTDEYDQEIFDNCECKLALPTGKVIESFTDLYGNQCDLDFLKNI